MTFLTISLKLVLIFSSFLSIGVIASYTKPSLLLTGSLPWVKSSETSSNWNHFSVLKRNCYWRCWHICKPRHFFFKLNSLFYRSNFFLVKFLFSPVLFPHCDGAFIILQVIIVVNIWSSRGQNKLMCWSQICVDRANVVQKRYAVKVPLVHSPVEDN